MAKKKNQKPSPSSSHRPEASGNTSRSRNERLHPDEQLANSVIDAAFRVAQESDSETVLIHLRTIPESIRAHTLTDQKSLLLIARSNEEAQIARTFTSRVVQIPPITLSRMGQMKVAVLIAMTKGFIHPHETVVALAGPGGRDSIDSLIVMDISRELELFSLAHEKGTLPAGVQPEVFERILFLASRLAIEGREGKSIGTIFVIGDVKRVNEFTTQLIINPFQGHPAKDCNILDSRLTETVKGFAAIDGAFIINGKGVIQSAGTLLPTSLGQEGKGNSGLGSRHAAARCISATTDCLAIAISQSTGTIRIYRGGQEVMAIQGTDTN